jgi:hypothetical protein
VERDSEPIPDWKQTWSRGSLGSLGRFQLRERLGDGGFGQVYLAYDPRLDRDVALKVLKERHPADRVMERFFREARAAARLDHPNIVAVHDAGFDDGRCWVAFHFVGGRSLCSYRDHHRLDPPTTARILRDLADAVDHAHHQGVLHRDLKPANVLIDDLGRPRLIDFGLARRSDLESSLTHDGAVVGTPAYMSPEQALGYSRQVDERSDVFSLGVIFFELLGGQRPYGADGYSTPSETLQRPQGGAERQAPAPSVRSINAAVPAALDRICRRAIARDPQERYPSARALADELDGWLLRDKSGGQRLSFAVSTIVLGVAAALLLVVGIQLALPRRGLGSGWNVWPVRASGAEDRPSPPTESGGAAASPLRHSGTPTPAVGADPGAGTLVGNSRKKSYHLATCPTVISMNRSNRILLRDAEEAASAGYQPCGVCRPPRTRSAEGNGAGP